MSATILLAILYLTCKGAIFIPTYTLKLYDVLSDVPLNLQNALSHWFIVKHLYSRTLLHLVIIYDFQTFCSHEQQHHPP